MLSIVAGAAGAFSRSMVTRIAVNRSVSASSAASRISTTSYQGTTIWGYHSSGTLEDFATLVTALLEVARTTAMFSGFCYTQFADTFQEANGLLYEDRTPKIPLDQLAQAVRGNPTHNP